MPQVKLMRFDKSQRRFNSYKTVKLASIPQKGEIISINNADGEGEVFSVYNVVYGDNENVDILVVFQMSSDDYFFKQGFPDII